MTARDDYCQYIHKLALRDRGAVGIPCLHATFQEIVFFRGGPWILQIVR